MKKNKPNAKKTQYTPKRAENRHFKHNSKGFKQYQKCYPSKTLHDESLTASPTIERLFSWFYNPYFHISADVSKGRKKPQWKTEKRYPIGKRAAEAVFHDPDTLIGFRPADTTRFGAYDIDAGSALHPSEAFGIAPVRRLLEVGEEHGLVAFQAWQSSFSGGIHLVAVFDTPIRSIEVAALLRSIALKAGFRLKAGELEAFPNLKTYVRSHKQADWSKYNGLRCPGQPGTGWQLLDDELNPVSDNSPETLVRHLEWVEARNDSEEIWRNAQIAHEEYLTSRVLRQPNSRERLIKDLHTQMDLGFTASGQTNGLLKLAGTLGRVEHSYRGETLQRFISETVRALPGYSQHCHHQHEIDSRAKDWATSVENFYWHISDIDKRRHGSFAEVWKRAYKPPIDPDRPTYGTYHAQRSDDAEDRLRGVLAALEREEKLFTSEATLFAAICEKGRELYGKAMSKRTWQKLKTRFTDVIISLLCKMGAIAEIPPIAVEAAIAFPTAAEPDKTAETQTQGGSTQLAGKTLDLPIEKNAETQTQSGGTQPRLYMKVFDYLSQAASLRLWQTLCVSGQIALYHGSGASGIISDPPPLKKRIVQAQHSRIEKIESFSSIEFLNSSHSSHFGKTYSELFVYVKPARSQWKQGVAVPLRSLSIPIDKADLCAQLDRLRASTTKFSLSDVIAAFCRWLCASSDRQLVVHSDELPFLMPPKNSLI